MFDTVIWWVRKDLRVHDNPALLVALKSARLVVPVYIWAPEEEGQFQPGRCSRWWLYQSLLSLQQDLEALGSRLTFRRSDCTLTALMHVAQETGAQAVFFNNLYDPIAMVRDHEIKMMAHRVGLECKTFNSDLFYEPWEILNHQQEPFICFEHYWNGVKSMPRAPLIPIPEPNELPPVPETLESLDISEVGLMSADEQASNRQLGYRWKPGRVGAHTALEKFLKTALPIFTHDRAKTDRDSTSKLSPHIHYGEISPRYIYYRVKEAETQGVDRKSCDDFLQQIGYREYSRYLSFHFPFTHQRSLLEHLWACPWKYDQRRFKAWRQGVTGYPLVDAGMRELWSTGWIHNRLRVVVGSFMVKNLLLPWQWGLKHFWDALLDADLECDALGWQYVAGCLADAHPFSYIMDYKKESLRFDPEGNYVRKWLPMLARMPTEYIHCPWEAPEHVLDDAGVELGLNYPERIITMEDARYQVDCAFAVIEQCAQKGHVQSTPFRPDSKPSSVDHVLLLLSNQSGEGEQELSGGLDRQSILHQQVQGISVAQSNSVVDDSCGTASSYANTEQDTGSFNEKEEPIRSYSEMSSDDKPCTVPEFSEMPQIVPSLSSLPETADEYNRWARSDGKSERNTREDTSIAAPPMKRMRTMDRTVDDMSS